MHILNYFIEHRVSHLPIYSFTHLLIYFKIFVSWWLKTVARRSYRASRIQHLCLTSYILHLTSCFSHRASSPSHVSADKQRKHLTFANRQIPSQLQNNLNPHLSFDNIPVKYVCTYLITSPRFISINEKNPCKLVPQVSVVTFRFGNLYFGNLDLFRV